MYKIHFLPLNSALSTLNNPVIDPLISEKVKNLQTLHAEGYKNKHHFNTNAFRKYLKNKQNGNLEIHFIENGFPLWKSFHNKGWEPSNLSTKINNLVCTKNDIIAFIDKITEECKKGQIEPINYDPKYVLMIFGTPKKDEFGLYTKTRVIRNGSFHASGKTAINQWIRKEKCNMRDLPNLKTYTKLLINNEYMSLRDLADFFRQIKLPESDADFVGYSLFGLRFRDRSQPYGVSSAPGNSQYFSTILVWILNNCVLNNNQQHLINSILVHIDDFVLAAKSKSDCKLLTNLFDILLRELKVKVSHHKSVNNVRKGIIYGIYWNLTNKTLKIPDLALKKLKYFITLVRVINWQNNALEPVKQSHKSLSIQIVGLYS